MRYIISGKNIDVTEGLKSAVLMTDGCDMGVKSLNKYLNEYEAAEEFAKDICKRLIKLEEKLRSEVKNYL